MTFPALHMTIRDYFAAQALQALLMAPREEWPIEFRTEPRVSVVAFKMADAMLRARKSRTPNPESFE